MEEGDATNAVRAQREKDSGLRILAAAHAALDNGQGEGHEERLAKAAHHLWEAYSLGAKESAVVWPLKQLWTYTGHLSRVLELLKDYLQDSDDPSERFLAGHYVVDTYALMRDDPNAVAHHRRYLAELGSFVPAWHKLWSLSDSTMMDSWKRSGQIEDWIDLTQSVYETVEIDDDSRLAVAYFLRTLSCVWWRLGRLDDASSCARRIIEIYRGFDTPDAFRLTGDAFCALLRFTEDPVERERTLRQALDLTWRIESARKEAAARRDVEGEKLAGDYSQKAHTVNHNLACCLKRIQLPEEAIELFERALTYRDSPLTRFFYAGALLKARGDRMAALVNLRKAASDPRSSLVHRFERAFRENPDFSPVHDDPEFLAIIRHGTARYSSVGELEPTRP